MADVPQGPTKIAAWLGFAALVLILCVVFPETLGLVLGIGGVIALTFVFYKLLGGESDLFK